jgi:hypothetical protein
MTYIYTGNCSACVIYCVSSEERADKNVHTFTNESFCSREVTLMQRASALHVNCVFRP